MPAAWPLTEVPKYLGKIVTLQNHSFRHFTIRSWNHTWNNHILVLSCPLIIWPLFPWRDHIRNTIFLAVFVREGVTVTCSLGQAAWVLLLTLLPLTGSVSLSSYLTSQASILPPAKWEYLQHHHVKWELKAMAAAATAAKSLQLCPTLCNPIDASPPGSSVPGILQERILEWVAISFSNAWMWKVKVKLLSPVQLFETPWTAAYQAPPSMGFSRQEYWSGLPLPSPKAMDIYIVTAIPGSRNASY